MIRADKRGDPRHEDRSPDRAVVAAGLLALLVGIGCAAVGVVLYGGDMPPNLLAELAGLPIEIALIWLIVDRFTAAQRRREWRGAYAAISVPALIGGEASDRVETLPHRPKHQ